MCQRLIINAIQDPIQTGEGYSTVLYSEVLKNQ